MFSYHQFKLSVYITFNCEFRYQKTRNKQRCFVEQYHLVIHDVDVNASTPVQYTQLLLTTPIMLERSEFWPIESMDVSEPKVCLQQLTVDQIIS